MLEGAKGGIHAGAGCGRCAVFERNGSSLCCKRRGRVAVKSLVPVVVGCVEHIVAAASGICRICRICRIFKAEGVAGDGVGFPMRAHMPRGNEQVAEADDSDCRRIPTLGSEVP